MRGGLVWMCLWGMMAVAPARAGVFVAELDPDVYFDRGVTFGAGWKPAAVSRWTVLASFATRKIGAVADRDRLNWRLGGVARWRFTGTRSGFFVQMGAGAAQRTAAGVVHHGISAQPGLGFEWHPGPSGFYAAPQVNLETYPGKSGVHPRLEIRVGWQFGR